ncbi:MAG TPA: succinate dehydrogenase assembly factor 2 [Paracoccaceae bacterium]|nr:succinate dehydrogenase assembly factor 2 [Paracoccaceae bacterium]
MGSDLMTEACKIQLKRLRLRSWRRGTREMDLILGGYIDSMSGQLEHAVLDAFEALLDEPDPDLYAWVAGSAVPPSAHADMIAKLRAFHGLG